MDFAFPTLKMGYCHCPVEGNVKVPWIMWEKGAWNCMEFNNLKKIDTYVQEVSNPTEL